MKKILFFLQYDNLGSSSIYRVLIYKDLFDNEYKTKYTYFWSNRYIKKYMLNKKRYFFFIIFSYIINVIKRFYYLFFVAPKYDIVFLQRCFIPLIKPIFLRYLKKRNIKIIFDIDDALHLSKFYYCNDIAKKSNCIIVGNRELKKYYSSFNKNVFLIPTVDNDLKYKPFIKNTFKNKCIGWIGSKSTINNLDILVNPLNSLIKKHPEIYFKVIVDDISGYDNKINHLRYVKWDKNTYLKEMSEFSIGVMPLKINDFNKGKCGFKLIQYLDLNKPVLATDIGENKYIVNNYGSMCGEDEWEKKIETLLFDEKEYRQCLSNIQSNFLQKYGYFTIYKKITEVINKEL